MSQIKPLGPGHWVGPEDAGYTPHFYTTERAARCYPGGALIQEDPLQPSNKRIELEYKDKEAAHMGEFFEGLSAGGHPNFLDMRINSVLQRGGGLYFSIFMAVIWLIVKLWSLADGNQWSARCR